MADRLILTCDENGVIQVWNFCAAILPDTRNDQNRILIATLKPPAFPYVSYRNVKVLAMRADEVQILLMLHCDKKEARVYVMDFLSESLNVKSSNARLSRKRRHSFQ